MRLDFINWFPCWRFALARDGQTINVILEDLFLPFIKKYYYLTSIFKKILKYDKFFVVYVYLHDFCI